MWLLPFDLFGDGNTFFESNEHLRLSSWFYSERRGTRSCVCLVLALSDFSCTYCDMLSYVFYTFIESSF